MDHFGPLTIMRGQKVHGLLFTCLTTRGVHIELCRSTKLEELMLAMDRFVQRRGKPRTIFSDQGTSFVRLDKEQDKVVGQLQKEMSAEMIARWRITYQFNPPGAPHWGGGWERLIQEIKKVLNAVAGHFKKLSYNGMETMLVRAEGILNRRPIGIDEEGKAICPMDIISPAARQNAGFPLDAAPLDMAKQVQEAVNQFWLNWKKGYISYLSAERIKGRHGQRTTIRLQAGDAVIIQEGTNNPFVEQWRTGKVREVHPSADGVIRRATVEVDGVAVDRDIRRLAVVEGAALQRM
jgi:hypothetical protein